MPGNKAVTNDKAAPTFGIDQDGNMHNAAIRCDFYEGDVPIKVYNLPLVTNLNLDKHLIPTERLITPNHMKTTKTPCEQLDTLGFTRFRSQPTMTSLEIRKLRMHATPEASSGHSEPVAADKGSVTREEQLDLEHRMLAGFA